MLKYEYGREGMYKGKLYTFTHRNPETGEVWSDDIPVKTDKGNAYGRWVNPDSVKWEDIVNAGKK